MRRKFAGEKLAQEFSDEWRHILFSEPFTHPDIIHNPPTGEELDFIEVWMQLNKPQRYHLVTLVLNAPFPELPEFRFSKSTIDRHLPFLKRAFCLKNA